MLIGIDASRAFLKQRTGIEEYSYQVIKHLRKNLQNAQVILYTRDNQEIDFDLPKNWKIKEIKLPYLWTQLGLSLEMLFHPVDTLFIPGHVVPPIHPKNTVATIHGVDFEFVPKAYFWWECSYMRWSIKKSCERAKKIIAVSDVTKQNLVNLYKVSEEKITIIHEGYSKWTQNSKLKNRDSKSLLFIGRIEERKNIVGIIKSFEILKEHYKISHKLILAGKPGHDFEDIKNQLLNVNCRSDIILPGFVSESKKWEMLDEADVFMFPSLYESFGLPVLEAQAAGVPVVASDIPSMWEVAGESAVLVDPMNAEEIADVAYKLISNPDFKSDIIKKGYDNVKRFSWDKCAAEISSLLIK